MKKLLTILLLSAITFSSFSGVIFAASVGQNGAGANNTGGGGIDTCTENKQYCPRGWIKVVAYRLTFVYAKSGGDIKMVTNADNSTLKSDSLDVWSEAWRKSSAYNYTKVKYITGNGSRAGHQASKVEYVYKGVKLWRVLNSSHKSTYVQGIHFITDSGLNNFVDNYSGKAVMEYFSGKPVTGNLEVDHAKLVEFAKRMHVIKATDNFSTLLSMGTDSEGYKLKLLIEPISVYMAGPNNNWIGGFFTATEIAMIMKYTPSGYTVDPNDANRSRCVFPLRGFLVSDDADLGFKAYTETTNCKARGAIPTDTILKNLGVMVVDLSDFTCTVNCDEPKIETEPCKVIYRTISLTNPFPGYDGKTRTPGANWQSEDNTTVNTYILNNRGVKSNEVYNEKPMYKITLTPTLIKEIRNYNSHIEKGYNDDSLIRCDDDTCELAADRVYQTTFVRTTLKNNFTGCIIDGSCIKAIEEQGDSEE